MGCPADLRRSAQESKKAISRRHLLTNWFMELVMIEGSQLDARFEGNEGCLIVSQSFPGEEPIAFFKTQIHAPYLPCVDIFVYLTSCTNNNKRYCVDLVAT